MELYNFIYKNEPLIHSFYAQIFGGLQLKDIKKSAEGSEETKETRGGYNSTFRSTKISTQVHQERLEEIDPHDIVTIDTLSFLSERAKHIDTAKAGEIVKFSATLFFLDKAVFDLIMPNIADFMLVNAPKKEHKEIKKLATLLRKLFESIRLDPLAFCHTEEDIVVGTIKDEYLQEPISSFHLKYGSKGISNCNIIAIKDCGSPIQFASEFQAGASEIVRATKEMVVPADASTITPIAIYQTIKV